MQTQSDQSRAGSTNGLSRYINTVTNNEKIVALLFILPSLIGFIAFYAIPAVRSLLISFDKWNLLTPAQYVGLQNYQELFSDKRFWASLITTISYVAISIPIQTALAVLIAVVMDRIYSSAFLRGILILPWLAPSVVVALLWLWILDPSLGVVNSALQTFGLPKQPFLGAPEQSLLSIAAINIWRYAGYMAILVFLGLRAIPNTLYEVAEIDGGNDWQQFWGISFPLLRPVLLLVLVVSIINSFQVFDTIAVTTGGGPAGSTRVIIYYIYEQLFAGGLNMGLATAASVVLFLILITVTIIQIRFLRANQSDLADYR